MIGKYDLYLSSIYLHEGGGGNDICMHIIQYWKNIDKKVDMI